MNNNYNEYKPMSSKTIITISASIIGSIGVLVGSWCYFAPKYRVYSATMDGEAEYAQAEQNRRITVLEAESKLEAAKSLAVKVSKASAEPSAQIVAAFRSVCTREPRPSELAALNELYSTQKANPPQFAPAPVKVAAPESKADPKAKKKPAPVPAPSGPKTPADPSLAALTLVCSTILASDAAVTSR
jgi:hypothetical protein